MSIKGTVFILIAAFIIFFAVSGVEADNHGCGMFQTTFKGIDVNQDGLVTYEELSSQHPFFNTSAFHMLDRNRDEVLSADEWNLFLKAHGVDVEDNQTI